MQVGPKRGLHVAIIMDGNGRWATQRGLPRIAGHRAGVDAVRRVVERAPDVGGVNRFGMDGEGQLPLDVPRKSVRG